MSLRVLVIDNYDSFTYNLVQLLAELGARVEVFRNDAIDGEGVEARDPDAVVLSPGPCTPHEAGCSMEVVRRLDARRPLLGVCLGHQAIAAALGGRVVRGPEPVHGMASAVFHDGTGLLAGLPSPLEAGRYHSLVVDPASLPPELEACAWTADGLIMGLRHRHRPVYGLQFHPESVLTPQGRDILQQFLAIAGRLQAERRRVQPRPTPPGPQGRPAAVPAAADPQAVPAGSSPRVEEGS
ncbi:aminodeoxychorismate/anthranilate synthase component II [Thermaerobacter sp. PB12/4term]|uniref:anthranilate synthase component II n=1 Tax=Thermaerobacter sp. PB12/4term TaxID=2293838 RepID=UPI000E32A139|nr:aminodeoxychorismate/anthranilate synthase component II [Thermaerobacter sp. PB12/4term]